jgi:hypothetical protein
MINADGSVTWGVVEQVTTANNGATVDFAINPSIVLDKNNVPVIFAPMQISITAPASGNSDTNAKINVLKRSNELYANSGIGTINANWTMEHVYNGGSYIQASPSAIFVPQSINGLANGRIWVAWHGLDATDTAATYIRVAYSDDGGVTWSAMQKLTS